MKDSEFIELLNLYVDHEISAEQAARLETEVAGSAERRRLYRQYCMIDKACSLLTDTVLEAAPQATVGASAAAEGDARRFWGWSGGFYAAGLLSAACLALAVVIRYRHSPAAPVAAVAHSHPALPPAPTIAQVDLPVSIPLQQHPVAFPTPFGSGEMQTVLNTHAFVNPALYVPAAALQTGAFAWMNEVHLSPIPRSALEPLPQIKITPLLLPNATINQLGSDNGVEQAAFQFTR